MLEREYAYYKTNRTGLVERYLDKFIVIADDTVIGVYDSTEEAYFDTIKKRTLGTFLIQEIVDDEEKLTKRFRSRVNV